MKAVKINIGGKSFLLPESHADMYDFEYIQANKANIIACIQAYEEWLKNPMSDIPSSPDMREFKEKTGIIGAPFNLHDPDLYALDRGVEIEMEINL